MAGKQRVNDMAVEQSLAENMSAPPSPKGSPNPEPNESGWLDAW